MSQTKAARHHPTTPQDDIKPWFGRKVQENLDALYGVALRLTGNHSDAEDLVADSVSKAWKAIGKLQDQGRFRPWLFRILHNHFISDYRKRSTRPVESSYCELLETDTDDSVSSYLMNQSDDFLRWWATPEQEFFNGLLRDQIMNAIDCLPDSFHITVILINVEGFSYDEAAEILGVPGGTIRSRMKRGRTLLQKALWTQAREAGIVSAETTKEK